MQTPYQIILAKQRQKRCSILLNQQRNSSPLVGQRNQFRHWQREAINIHKNTVNAQNFHQNKQPLKQNYDSKPQLQNNGTNKSLNMSIQSHRMKIEQLLKKQEKTLTMIGYKTTDQRSLEYYNERCRSHSNGSSGKANILRTFYVKNQQQGKKLYNNQNRRIFKGSNIKKNFSFQDTSRNFLDNSQMQNRNQLMMEKSNEKLEEIRDIISHISTRNKTMQKSNKDGNNVSFGQIVDELTVSAFQIDQNASQNSDEGQLNSKLQQFQAKADQRQCLHDFDKVNRKAKNVQIFCQKPAKSLESNNQKSNPESDKPVRLKNSVVKSAALNQTISYSSRWKIIHSSRQNQAQSLNKTKNLFKTDSPRKQHQKDEQKPNKIQKQRQQFYIPRGEKIELSDLNEQYRVCLEDVGIYPQKDYINDQALTNFIKSCKKKRISIKKYSDKLVESLKSSIKTRQNKSGRPTQLHAINEYDRQNRQRNRKFAIKGKNNHKNNENMQQKDIFLKGWQNHDIILQNNESDLFKGEQ